MSRRISVRGPNEDHSGASDESRRLWVAKWKASAVAQMPGDTPLEVKVQLRADVDRALARYRPDDDEAEISDIVSSVVEEARTRLTAKLSGQLQEAGKKLVIALAPVYLRAALAKFDQRLVTAMLKRPGSSSAALTARLQGHLEHRLKGDDDQSDVQRLVDAWVARRLAEQPPASTGRLRSALGAAGAVATAGVAAYQNPTVKAAVDQGLTKAHQLIQRWWTPPPPSAPPPQETPDAAPDN